MVDRYTDSSVKIVEQKHKKPKKVKVKEDEDYRVGEEEEYKRGTPVGLIIGIIVAVLLVAVIAVPIGALYVFLYDGTHVEPETKKISNIQDHITSILIDSFDDIGNKESDSYGKLEFAITQAEVNGFIVDTLNSYVPAGADQYLNGVYALIEGDQFNFYVELQVPLFKTRIKLTTEITDSTETEDPDDFLTFTIKDISIGQIGGIYNFAKGIIDNYIDIQSYVETAIQATGLGLEFDWDNSVISYSQSAFTHDILDQLDTSSMGANAEMITLIFQEALSAENSLAFGADDEDKALVGTIDLNSLEAREGYYNEKDSAAIDADAYRDAVTYLVNEAGISADYVQSLFNYLYLGYSAVSFDAGFVSAIQAVSEAQWAEVNKLIGLTETTNTQAETGEETVTYGAISPQNYNIFGGLPYELDMGLSAAVTEQINRVDYKKFINNKEEFNLAYLTSADFNDQVQAQDILGFTVPLTSKQDDGTYKIQYITVDDVYFTFLDNLNADGSQNTDVPYKIAVVLELDLNGFKSNIILDISEVQHIASEDESGETLTDNYKFTLHVDDVSIGQHILGSDSELFNSVFDLLYDMMAEELTNDSYIQVDNESKSLSFYIGHIITDSVYNIGQNYNAESLLDSVQISIGIDNAAIETEVEEPAIVVKAKSDYEIKVNTSVTYVYETDPETGEIVTDPETGEPVIATDENGNPVIDDVVINVDPESIEGTDLGNLLDQVAKDNNIQPEVDPETGEETKSATEVMIDEALNSEEYQNLTNEEKNDLVNTIEAMNDPNNTETDYSELWDLINKYGGGTGTIPGI